MVNFTFDLQLFGAPASLADAKNPPTVEAYLVDDNGWIEVDDSNPTGTETIIAYYNSGTYYVDGSLKLSATNKFSGTVSFATFSTPTTGKVAYSADAGAKSPTPI